MKNVELAFNWILENFPYSWHFWGFVSVLAFLSSFIISFTCEFSEAIVKKIFK
jgi:hypothetical protein